MKNQTRNAKRYIQMAEIINYAGSDVTFCQAYALFRQGRILSTIKNFPFTTGEWQHFKRVVLAGKKREVARRPVIRTSNFLAGCD